MGYIGNLSGIAEYAAEVTPADGADIPNGGRCIGIYVGTAGDLAVRFDGRPDSDSETTTFVGVPAGAVIPARIRRVMNTNTDASDLVALYARG